MLTGLVRVPRVPSAFFMCRQLPVCRQLVSWLPCSAWFRSCCFCYDVSSLPCFQFCPAVSYEATVLSVLLTLGLPCNIAVWNLPTAPLYRPADVNRVQSVGLVRTYVRGNCTFCSVTWRQSFGFLLCCSVFRGLSWLGVVGVLPPAVWVPSVTGRSCSLVSQLLCSY